MKVRLRGSLRISQISLLLFLLSVNATSAVAQKPSAKATSQPRLLLAINEGGSANVDAADILLRYEAFRKVIETALRQPLLMVAVRDRRVVKESLKSGAYALLLSRPNDVPAEAVRDNGYQPVVVAKVPAHAIFIVTKNSPLRTITDVRGKSIVTPDQYSNMWRIANAMLRDNKIFMANEKVRSMRDQAAIGWSMENGFFDVGVVNSISGVGRTWERNGGRVIAKSPETPNTPLIAAPSLSAAQIGRIRSVLVALDTSETGKAVLKEIGLTGFREAHPEEFLDFLKWLGELEIPAR